MNYSGVLHHFFTATVEIWAGLTEKKNMFHLYTLSRFSTWTIFCTWTRQQGVSNIQEPFVFFKSPTDFRFYLRKRRTKKRERMPFSNLSCCGKKVGRLFREFMLYILSIYVCTMYYINRKIFKFLTFFTKVLTARERASD